VNDLSEKEQLDEIRAWWAEYGTYVIVGLVLGGGIILGWNQWQSSIANTREQASLLYEQIMEAVPEGDVATAEAAMATLSADYARTVYPAQARLALARLYMDKGRDQDAATVLRELVATDDDSIISLVARLRLAKILLYQNKPDEVIELLRNRESGAFAARYLEVLGDAYVAKGQYADADAAYSAALAQDQVVQTIDPALLQLKLNDLPDLSEVAATSSAIEAASAAPGGELPAAEPATEEPTTEDAAAADPAAADAPADEAGTPPAPETEE